MHLPLRLALHSLILVKHRRAILVLVYLVPNQLEQLVLERLRLSVRLHHQLLELQQVSLQVKIPVLHCLIHLLNLQDKHLDSLLVRLLHHHPDLVNLHICIFILLFFFSVHRYFELFNYSIFYRITLETFEDKKLKFMD